MKKILLLSLSAAISYCSFAQDAPVMSVNSSINGADLIMPTTPVTPITEKTTALGDTLPFATQSQAQGPQWSNINRDYATPFDSGALYGINATGYTGFAQHYNLKFDQGGTVDSSIQIVGVVSRWFGRVQTSSTKKVDITVWSRNTSKVAVTGRNKFYVYGLPNTALKTQSFDAKTLVAASLSGNSAVAAYFTSPLTGVNSSVYVGYTMSYTWAGAANDTFGLRSAQASQSNTYTLESGSGDTLVTANVVTQDGGTWKSNVYTLNASGGDMVIFPLIRLDCPTCWKNGIGGVEASNLTFHGAYPNPATNFANVAFSLKERADVTVTLMDATGKAISSTVRKDMIVGKNEVRIETSNLAAGNYIVTIENSKGGGVASQLVIAK